jgi:hypothetical protein
MRPLVACLGLSLLVVACEREERAFRPDPAATETPIKITQTTVGPARTRRRYNAAHLAHATRITLLL